jgi:hypothetical protein
MYDICHLKIFSVNSYREYLGSIQAHTGKGQVTTPCPIRTYHQGGVTFLNEKS